MQSRLVNLSASQGFTTSMYSLLFHFQSIYADNNPEEASHNSLLVDGKSGNGGEYQHDVDGEHHGIGLC